MASRKHFGEDWSLVDIERPFRVIGIVLALAMGVARAQETAPASAPVAPAAAQGGTIRGSVVAGVAGKPGGVPLPGVAVTATNSLTGKKYATTTDIDGAYAMTIPRNGRYVVRVELAAFAAQTAEVIVNAAGDNGGKPQQTAEFGLMLASRAAAAEARQNAAAPANTLARGLQSLNLSGGEADVADASANAGGGANGAALPSLGGLADAGGSSTDSVAVSGQMGQTNGLAGFSEDEIRSRVEDAVAQARASGQIPQGSDPSGAIMVAIGGMMGGGGGSSARGGRSGGGGRGAAGGGGGAFRGFNPAQPHGSFFYTGDYSAFDSAPWSTTLTPTAKPTYTKNSFGASLLGSPYLPGLTKPNTKNFLFLNFAGRRDTNPEVLNGTVPTLLERSGDFSKSTQFVNGAPAPVVVTDPKTGLPFAGDKIPQCALVAPGASCVSPQAQAILNSYYPAANITAVGTSTYNYQTITTAGANSASINSRYVRNFGQQSGLPGFTRAGGGGGGRNANAAGGKPTLRQNLNAAFSYSHAASDLRNIFLPLGGTSASDGYGLNAGYTIGYGRLSNNTSLNWNRSHAKTQNYFTGTGLNPAAVVGVNEPAQASINGLRPNFYNGLPNLNFTNFTSLNNTAAQDSINQTISFSDFVSYRHKKHNYRFGFDLRRVHQDSLGGNNPLGSLTFSGIETGSGFGDFLLGLPQQARIQAGLNKIYLREWVSDAYAQDDFRVKANLTLNFGLRWEYFGPFSEKNGRLSNLTGVTTGVTTVGCVTPFGATVRGITCAPGSTSSLLHSDDTMYSPRVGVAWHPKALKDTVIRAGYGINFNTTQFATFAKNLSYQQPFALTENNALPVANGFATGCALGTNGQPTGTGSPTLASAFGCAPQPFQNTYAVNPNYRLGYVQVYNVDIQKTLPLGVVLNLGYNGSKGADLDLLRAPNHTLTPTGFAVTTPQAVAFTYEDSIGQSHFNALTVNARKRLQRGIAIGGTYQYAHSIDDVCNIGSASTISCLQNDARLDLEEANSTFDVRHKLTGDWTIELPFGPNRAFLNKGGKLAAALDGFLVSGDFTFASGSYFTPQFQSSANEIAGGGTFTQRPDRVPGQPIAGAGKLRNYFNQAAFASPTDPVTGALHYGSASRNSIEGPGQVVVDASLSRSVKLGDTRNFEGRITASNVFNTVQYNGINTTLNSATFGQVTGAAAQRRINFTARYRF